MKKRLTWAWVMSMVLLAALPVACKKDSVPGILPPSGNTYDITVEAGESIQTAIDSAKAGDKILIKEGTYAEQLMISGKNITLVGEGNVVISGPEDYATMKTMDRVDDAHTLDVVGIISINENSAITVQNITVRGDAAKAAKQNTIVYNRYAGIGIVNSNVTLSNCKVSDIILEDGESGLMGMQTGYGIYICASEAKNVAIENCTIQNFQKGGIYSMSPVAVVTIKKTLIAGVGDTNKIAQNGICGASSFTIEGCNIKDLRYTDDPDETQSCGIYVWGDSITESHIRDNVYTNVEKDYLYEEE